MTGTRVTRSDIDETEQKLHWTRKQMAELFEEQQIYMQDIINIAQQYQEHLKQLQTARYQYQALSGTQSLIVQSRAF